MKDIHLLHIWTFSLDGDHHMSESDPIKRSEMLEAWIVSDNFSCLGARTALRRSLLRCVDFGDFGTTTSALGLHREIVKFSSSALGPTQNFATFVAVFSGPTDISESEFESLLWQQLRALHEIDRGQYRWSPDASSDPDSPNFSFSIAGHPFFVVGLHGRASRISRRFPFPALAFNSQRQFDQLREAGIYEGIEQGIRRREIRLEGSINPNLANFGEMSRARQYSGRATESDWTCPFKPDAPPQ